MPQPRARGRDSALHPEVQCVGILMVRAGPRSRGGRRSGCRRRPPTRLSPMFRRSATSSTQCGVPSFRQKRGSAWLGWAEAIQRGCPSQWCGGLLPRVPGCVARARVGRVFGGGGGVIHRGALPLVRGRDGIVPCGSVPSLPLPPGGAMGVQQTQSWAEPSLRVTPTAVHSACLGSGGQGRLCEAQRLAGEVQRPCVRWLWTRSGGAQLGRLFFGLASATSSNVPLSPRGERDPGRLPMSSSSPPRSLAAAARGPVAAGGTTCSLRFGHGFVGEMPVWSGWTWERYLSCSLPAALAPVSCPSSPPATPYAPLGGVPRAGKSAATISGGPCGAARATGAMEASADTCSGACGSAGYETRVAASARRSFSRSAGVSPSGACCWGGSRVGHHPPALG